MSDLVYSPGLEGIVAGETAISSISDGLRYRGFRVEELAELATFEEVAYLLLHGELPTAAELKAFRKRLSAAMSVKTSILSALRNMPRRTPLMDVMRSGASLLAHDDPDVTDNSREADLWKAERLLATLPALLAAAWRLRQSQEPVAADSHLSLAGNLLWMLRRRIPTVDEIRALDISLILYAEHEFNASTFTARVIASTLSDLHSAVVGAIGALKGQLHGGANERVLDLLAMVGTPENAETWVREALARKERLMGFGHRVYKSGDPRATFLQPWCERLAVEAKEQSLEKIASTIERVVAEEKELRPNLDWPSARLYHYLGLPVEIYTPLFVVSRVAGWSAHVIEQHENNRLIRPQARYIGSPQREFVPLTERG